MKPACLQALGTLAEHKTMGMRLLTILLLIFPACVLSQTLVETGGGLKRPGGTLQLTCTVSGFSLSTYSVHWVRQPAGKGLEWIGRIWSDGSTNYNSTLQSRLSITKDNSKSQVFMQLRNVQPEDTSTYYCARHVRGYGYFDYWGQGTPVTVTTASQSAPSLFPLIPPPSLDITGSQDVTVGCLAKDFLPDSLTISWQKPNNESLEAAKIMRFPSFLKSGVFTTSSGANVPADLWQGMEPFYCKAELNSQTKVVRVVRQTPVAPMEPTIAVRVPPLEDFQGPYLNATLVCLAEDLHTDKTNIKWLEDGQLLTSGFTTTAPTRQGRGGYSMSSELIVTKKAWFANKIYSCWVQNANFNDMRNVSKDSVCQGCSGTTVPVEVRTIPPSFYDIYFKKAVDLTCRISNLPFDQDVAEINVTWIRERDGKQLETKFGQPTDQENNGLTYMDAKATICRDEWDSGDNFLCKVSLPLLAATKTVSLKKENGGSYTPPSVYVLPPPSEELASRETATISCLVKDFYPNNFFVQWQRNGELVGDSDYFTSTPVLESKSPKRYLSYSTLIVTEQDWSSGATYTCVVGHEKLPYETTQKTIDKNTGKPTLVNVSLVLSDIASSCH